MAQGGYEPGPYGIWVTSSTRWDSTAPTTDEFRLKALFIKTKKKDTIYIIHASLFQAFIYIQVTYQILMMKPSLKQRFKFVKPLYNHNLVTALLDKSNL